MYYCTSVVNYDPQYVSILRTKNTILYTAAVLLTNDQCGVIQKGQRCYLKVITQTPNKSCYK